ncbi:MAG: hypothetical protein FJ215_02550 [Ignavibacteria bacterium]|nr:hypothetical protein [Ignavibacteria bacterium]
MNTGQTLLTIAALLLLGTTVISVNRNYSNHGMILRQSEIGLYAVSLATSIIEEASGNYFDEATINDNLLTTTALTSASGLGPDADEVTSPVSTTAFDDFDDYNNLNLTVTVPGVDVFRLRAQVFYVNPSAPNTPVTTKTFHKHLKISVTSGAMADTVSMSYVFSYFNFR